MFQPGAIRKITLKNFVTHTYVEVEPGPKLNMILGSNGSGKSTIVAGIILGLGGTPKVIGRGNRVSEYIKHNCNEATITLLLQGFTENEPVEVIRSFDRRDITTWKVNENKVTLKELNDHISKFKIQVNNLCQFLPQDRVADFAKMNKQELLKQTQIALCRSDLLQKQEQLVIDRERQRFLLDKVAHDERNLLDLKSVNKRLEGKVKNFNKRRKYLNLLDDIARKELWVQYLKLVDQRSKIKEDRDAAQKIYQQQVNSAKPIEENISAEKRNLEKLKKELSILRRDVQTYQKGITAQQDRAVNYQSAIKTTKEDVKRQLSELERKQNEIKSHELRLEHLLSSREEIKEQVQIEDKKRTELKNQNLVLENKISKLVSLLSPLRDKKSAVLYQIHAFENQKRSQERLQEGRMALLQKLDQGAYNATLWLQNNQNLFNAHIYKPMMLEINVKKPEHALFIENSIGFRDKIAFICTDKGDLKLFTQHMTQNKFNVNVLYQDPKETRPQSKIPIENLRKFGFDCYLDSLITAPEPIMVSLCRRNNFRNIPVAFKDSHFNVKDVPLNTFYRADTKHSVSVSNYTGAKSTRSNKIWSDNTLTTNIDVEKLTQIDGEISRLKTSIEPIQREMQEVEGDINNIRQQKRNLMEEIQKVSQMPQELMKLDQKVRDAEARVRHLKASQEICTVEIIKQTGRDKILRTVEKLKDCMSAMKDQYRLLTIKLKDLLSEEKNVETCRRKIQELENEAEDVRQLVAKASTTLQHVCDAYAEITREAKHQLLKAKEKSGGFAPDEPGFAPFLKMYEELPSNAEELNQERERITSNLSCLSNAADDNELREFEERLASIEDLEVQLRNEQSELNELTQNVEIKQNEWLEPLEGLVETINRGFSQAFQSMNCAGEVKIYKGDDEKDYENYGISVNVTYRNGAPLQELNTVTQSGGERAVATAAYMLSMQELTPVPFRCVDEINQGMDSNNERRIFSLLVDVTSKPDTSQYFFITPKLVPNLYFNESVKIHFVHNGAEICKLDVFNKTFHRLNTSQMLID